MANNVTIGKRLHDFHEDYERSNNKKLKVEMTGGAALDPISGPQYFAQFPSPTNGDLGSAQQDTVQAMDPLNKSEMAEFANFTPMGNIPLDDNKRLIEIDHGWESYPCEDRKNETVLVFEMNNGRFIQPWETRIKGILRIKSKTCKNARLLMMPGHGFNCISRLKVTMGTNNTIADEMIGNLSYSEYFHKTIQSNAEGNNIPVDVWERDLTELGLINPHSRVKNGKPYISNMKHPVKKDKILGYDYVVDYILDENNWITFDETGLAEMRIDWPVWLLHPVLENNMARNLPYQLHIEFEKSMRHFVRNMGVMKGGDLPTYEYLKTFALLGSIYSVHDLDNETFWINVWNLWLTRTEAPTDPSPVIVLATDETKAQTKPQLTADIAALWGFKDHNGLVGEDFVWWNIAWLTNQPSFRDTLQPFPYRGTDAGNYFDTVSDNVEITYDKQQTRIFMHEYQLNDKITKLDGSARVGGAASMRSHVWDVQEYHIPIYQEHYTLPIIQNEVTPEAICITAFRQKDDNNKGWMPDYNGQCYTTLDGDINKWDEKPLFGAYMNANIRTVTADGNFNTFQNFINGTDSAHPLTKDAIYGPSVNDEDTSSFIRTLKIDIMYQGERGKKIYLDNSEIDDVWYAADEKNVRRFRSRKSPFPDTTFNESMDEYTCFNMVYNKCSYRAIAPTESVTNRKKNIASRDSMINSVMKCDFRKKSDNATRLGVLEETLIKEQTGVFSNGKTQERKKLDEKNYIDTQKLFGYSDGGIWFDPNPNGGNLKHQRVHPLEVFTMKVHLGIKKHAYDKIGTGKRVMFDLQPLTESMDLTNPLTPAKQTLMVKNPGLINNGVQVAQVPWQKAGLTNIIQKDVYKWGIRIWQRRSVYYQTLPDFQVNKVKYTDYK